MWMDKYKNEILFFSIVLLFSYSIFHGIPVFFEAVQVDWYSPLEETIATDGVNTQIIFVAILTMILSSLAFLRLIYPLYSTIYLSSSTIIVAAIPAYFLVSVITWMYQIYLPYNTIQYVILPLILITGLWGLVTLPKKFNITETSITFLAVAFMFVFTIKHTAVHVTADAGTIYKHFLLLAFDQESLKISTHYDEPGFLFLIFSLFSEENYLSWIDALIVPFSFGRAALIIAFYLILQSNKYKKVRNKGWLFVILVSFLFTGPVLFPFNQIHTSIEAGGSPVIYFAHINKIIPIMAAIYFYVLKPEKEFVVVWLILGFISPGVFFGSIMMIFMLHVATGIKWKIPENFVYLFIAFFFIYIASMAFKQQIFAGLFMIFAPFVVLLTFIISNHRKVFEFLKNNLLLYLCFAGAYILSVLFFGGNFGQGNEPGISTLLEHRLHLLNEDGSTAKMFGFSLANIMDPNQFCSNNSIFPPWCEDSRVFTLIYGFTFIFSIIVMIKKSDNYIIPFLTIILLSGLSFVLITEPGYHIINPLWMFLKMRLVAPLITIIAIYFMLENFHLLKKRYISYFVITFVLCVIITDQHNQFITNFKWIVGALI